MKKKLVILGSTGNLGGQTLEVLEKYWDDFELIGISGHKNKDLLQEQAEKLSSPTSPQFQTALTSTDGPEALVHLATLPEADIVINVLSGLSGVEPSIAALQANKILLTANKESIVVEGEKIMELAQPGQLIPLDSEHNAIFEILKWLEEGENGTSFSGHPENFRLILPCSGGPFHQFNAEELATKTIADALKHPRWDMGPKVSLESALLLNKGLEVIEAHYLFDIPLDRIEVRIHPECQIHGMVDSIAYISEPNMKEHIENALLRALGRPTKSSDKIQLLSPDQIPQLIPNHALLPGIEIIKHHHQNKTLKEFLLHEEEIIQKATSQKDGKFNNLALALQVQNPALHS